MVVLVLLFFVCNLLLWPASQGCEFGWVNYQEDCLWFSNQKLIWTKAEDDCRSKGGYLMSDDNLGKHNFVATFLNAFIAMGQHSWFIGGSDSVIEDQWRWLETGLPFNFTRWAAGEPNGNNTENCLDLNFNQDNELVWKDVNCGSIVHHNNPHHHHPTTTTHGDKYYICEKPNSS